MLSAKQLNRALDKLSDIDNLAVEIYYFDPPEAPIQRPNSSVELGSRCLVTRLDDVKRVVIEISALTIKRINWDSLEPIVEYKFLRRNKPVLVALFSKGKTMQDNVQIAPAIIDGKIAVFDAYVIGRLIEFARDRTQKCRI